MVKQLNPTAQFELTKKNLFFQLWKTFKDAIFNVLFVLLDKQQQQAETMHGIVYQSTFDYIQMLAFPFNAAIISVWNGSQTLNAIIYYMNVANINNYLPSITFTTYLILVYLLIVAIILVIIDIIYVSYSFSKKKFRFTWPLVILSKIVPLFVTILFLPITETLFSMINCKTSEQDPSYQVLENYQQVQCFRGWHLFHASVTLLFTSIFVFISSIVALALFQPRMQSNKLAARQNSEAQVIFIINKICCLLIFSIRPFTSTAPYICILFFLSLWLFYAYNIDQPYYDKTVTKFYKICSSYYIWTTFMLFCCQVLQATNFNGGLISWFAGLPFIGTIIFYQKKSSIEKLISAEMKFKSGEELYAHLKYILQLMHQQKHDKNSYIFLIGYIEKHKELCNEQDCPLRQQNLDEDKRLVKHLERLYKSGIRKYPYSTKLRLSYAFFLLERIKNRNRAYEEFLKAEKTKPSFSEEFIIYRFKKIIKDNLEGEDNEENKADLIEIIKFQNHVALCQQAIKLSTRLKKQFWNELREQKPDLSKLKQTGSQITKTVESAKNNFLEIQKINTLIAQIVYNYAIYCIYILQDYLNGYKLLEQSNKKKSLVNINSRKSIEIDSLRGVFEKQNSSAIIVVSASPAQFGKITRTNLRFSELSGYLESQIIYKTIQKLLSKVYESCHNDHMLSWINNPKKGYLKKSHLSMLKQRNGMIIPIKYTVNLLELQQVFICKLEAQTTIKNVCYAITDLEGVVTEWSAGFAAYFDVDVGFNIVDLLKCGELDILDKQKQKIVEIGQVGETRKFRIKASELSTQTKTFKQTDNQHERLGTQSKESVILGYLFTVQKLHDDKQLLNRSRNNKSSQVSSVKYNSVIGVQKLYDEVIDEGELLQYYTKEVDTKEFFDYGVGIRTLILKNKELHLVDDTDKQEFNNIFEDSTNQDLSCINFNDPRSVELLKAAINTNLSHKEIITFRGISIVIVTILMILSYLQGNATMNSYNSLVFFMKNNFYRVQQQTFLNTIVASSFENSTNVNYTSLEHQISNRNVQFVSPLFVAVLLQNINGLNYTAYPYANTSKNLIQAIVLIESRFLEFYGNTSNSNSMRTNYHNYFRDLYPVLSQYVEGFYINYYEIGAYVLSILVVSIVLLILWIRCMSMIKKKQFDILIWFLDIPMPYLSFLCEKYDKYLKGFVSMKQSKEQQKIEQDQYFSNKFEQQQQKQEVEGEMQQQQIIRKSLINKHKKGTLLDGVHLSYFKYSAIIVYFLLFSGINIIYYVNDTARFNFLNLHYTSAINCLYNVGVLQIVYKMQDLNMDLNLSANGGPTQNLSTLSTVLRNNLLDDPNLKDFNLNMMNYQNSDISKLYAALYFTTFCNDPTDTLCSSLLSGNLDGGLTSFTKYLYLNNRVNSQQFFQANQNYIFPNMLNLLQLESGYLSDKFTSDSTSVLIIAQVYMVLTILMLLTIWLFYLSKMNEKLNQTIRMLNMIPLKVLPNSSKETKKFIQWIIDQSNKQKHNDI